jgi:predicted nucleic acid-binding Zn ribbon protein
MSWMVTIVKKPCSSCGRPLEVSAASRPEPTCWDCRGIIRTYERKRGTPRPKKPCGTFAAYRRHIRNGETPCRPCKDAKAEESRRYPRKRVPAVRPGRFCLVCDAPLVKGRHKFCSAKCLQTPLSSRVWPKNCISCKRPFIARNPEHQTCGEDCKLAHRKAYDMDRVRWKHSRRRAAQRLTDITPRQEAELRRKTRKCQMPGCGRWLTSRPHLPNSKHLDHILPLGVGGTHTWGNVRIICQDCNLKRPKDGSDFTGQLTLWAAAPGVSVVAKPPRPTAPPRTAKLCGCGNEFSPRGGGARCRDCIVKLGRDAAALRETGMRWEDIAVELGYSNAGNLHTYAVKYGGYGPRGYRRLNAAA